MIHFYIGYECGDYLDCDKSKKCKYKPKFYKLHNLSVTIHRFFEYRLHIKLPYLINICQIWKRLSGTSKCPYHKSRNYDCYDCEYVTGYLLRECSCKERIDTPCNERLSPIKTEWGYRCAYFKKCPWADNHKIEEEYFSK